MISLEQVRQLDIRVKKAVGALKVVSAENTRLKAEITALKARLEELNEQASSRIADEQELEVSLQGVLDVLDEVNTETADIEPEPPADNYVIETVSLDDEEADAEPQPPAETADTSPEADSPEEPASREAETPIANAESVAEEIPGVGHVVEFTSPAVDEPAAEPTGEEPAFDLTGDELLAEPEVESPATPDPPTAEVPASDTPVDEKDAEEVDLSSNDDETGTGSEEEFRSEFDIF